MLHCVLALVLIWNVTFAILVMTITHSLLISSQLTCGYNYNSMPNLLVFVVKFFLLHEMANRTQMSNRLCLPICHLLTILLLMWICYWQQYHPWVLHVAFAIMLHTLQKSAPCFYALNLTCLPSTLFSAYYKSLLKLTLKT